MILLSVISLAGYMFYACLGLTIAWGLYSFTKPSKLSAKEKMIDDAFQMDLENYKSGINQAETYGKLMSIKLELERFISGHASNYMLSQNSQKKIREVLRLAKAAKQRLTPKIYYAHR